MIRTEIYCDRCRVLIAADRSKLVVECGPLRARPTESGGPTLDLCRECTAELSAWLKGDTVAVAIPPSTNN